MDEHPETMIWGDEMDTMIKDAAGQADDSGVCELCN